MKMKVFEQFNMQSVASRSYEQFNYKDLSIDVLTEVEKLTLQTNTSCFVFEEKYKRAEELLVNIVCGDFKRFSVQFPKFSSIEEHSKEILKSEEISQEFFETLIND